MEAHIIVNLKFTYYIISAMEARIIINQKFTNILNLLLARPVVNLRFIMMRKLVEKMDIY